MRYSSTRSAHLLLFILNLFIARGAAFFLHVASSFIMNGASPPAAAAAALAAAAKPGTMEERPAAAVPAATEPTIGVESGGGSSGSPSHLVVLAHGLAGTADDLSYLKQSLERAGGPSVLVHSARSNEGKTKDGVAEGGVRLANEIKGIVSSQPSLSRISLVGNSLGGLYIRYAAKLLYRSDSAEGALAGATIAGLQPSVFMTIASPHLGVRRFTYVPLPSMLHPLAGLVVGKTGADLFLARSSAAAAAAASVEPDRSGGESDVVGGASLQPPSTSSKPPYNEVGDRILGDHQAEKSGGVGGVDPDGGDGRATPLLYSMATCEEFLRPLKAFRWRRAYANRRGDFMVPYGTAAFLEPGEGDGSAARAGGDAGRTGARNPRDESQGAAGVDIASGVGANASPSSPAAVAGSGSLTFADRILGAKKGTIVGVTWVPPVAAASRGHGRGVEATTQDPPAGQTAAAWRKVEKRRSMEEEMAAGLNSCGWEKVSVDFGCLAPVSHNKICALSRTWLTTALYGSGKSIVDHAADFLVTHDRKGDGDDGDGGDHDQR